MTAKFHPMYEQDCPACGHPMKYHDGVGCCAEYKDQYGLDSFCPCRMSQAMPDKPPVFNAARG